MEPYLMVQQLHQLQVTTYYTRWQEVATLQLNTGFIMKHCIRCQQLVEVFQHKIIQTS